MGAPPLWWWWPCGSILVEDGQLGSRNLDAGCRHYFLFLILTLLLLIQLLNSILGMRLPHLVLQLLTNGSIKKFWQRVTFATFTKLVAFSTPKTDRICHFFALCHIFAQILVWRKPKRKIWASNKMLIVLNESNTVVINMAWIGIFLILIIMRLIGRLMS